MSGRFIFAKLITLTHFISRPDESQELNKNLKSIDQVYGTIAYDFENESFGSNSGLAHSGFPYPSNESWSLKIIIDRGKATSVGERIATNADGNISTVQNESEEGAYFTVFQKLKP